MALNDIDSLPSNSAGLTYTTSATNWGAGTYTQITSGLSSEMYIISIAFQFADNPGDDTTVENLIELATGESGSEVVKIQLPMPVRRDSNAGYYPRVSVSLPEPLLVSARTRIAFRIYSSGVSEVFNGVKIMYQEGVTPETKLYLHADGNPNTGTFPASEQSSTTPTYTWGSGLRFMDTNIGIGQNVLKNTSLGLTGTRTAFIGFFASPPLDTNQTIGGSGTTLTLSTAAYQSLSVSFWAKSLNVYVWRPSTNTKVGTIIDSAATSLGGSQPTAGSERTSYITSIATSGVSAIAGDVIICEVWASFSDEDSYDLRFYYDGTTETNTENTLVSNHASYVSFVGQTITFSPISKTRLYFHEEINPLGPSGFPTNEQSSTTASYNWTTGLRSMNTTIGISQISNSQVLGGGDTGVVQRSFINWFASPALLTDQTIGGENIVLNIASKYITNFVGFYINRLNIYVWRPSTNTKVGVIKDSAATDITPPTGNDIPPTSINSQQVTYLPIITTSAVSALAGDVIICEIWGRSGDEADSATAYFYFDGTTVTTVSGSVVSNHASYVEFNQDIQFATVPKTRLYFHNASLSIPGSLPTNEQSTKTSGNTWTGSTTLRTMNTTIGSSQVTVSDTISTDISETSVDGFVRFFSTSPIGSPVTISGFLTLNIATSVSNSSNANANDWDISWLNLYVWRPATNTKISTLYQGSIPARTSANTSEVVDIYYGISLTSQTVVAGDVIICEIWDSYTNNDGSSFTANIYYDGNTVNTIQGAVVSNHASFIEFNTIIPFASTLGPNDGNFFLII